MKEDLLNLLYEECTLFNNTDTDFHQYAQWWKRFSIEIHKLNTTFENVMCGKIPKKKKEHENGRIWSELFETYWQKDNEVKILSGSVKIIKL